MGVDLKQMRALFALCLRGGLSTVDQLVSAAWLIIAVGEGDGRMQVVRCCETTCPCVHALRLAPCISGCTNHTFFLSLDCQSTRTLAPYAPRSRKIARCKDDVLKATDAWHAAKAELTEQQGRAGRRRELAGQVGAARGGCAKHMSHSGAMAHTTALYIATPYCTVSDSVS